MNIDLKQKKVIVVTRLSMTFFLDEILKRTTRKNFDNCEGIQFDFCFTMLLNTQIVIMDCTLKVECRKKTLYKGESMM